MKQILLGCSSILFTVATSVTALAMNPTVGMTATFLPTHEVFRTLGVVSITTVAAWALHRWENRK